MSSSYFRIAVSHGICHIIHKAYWMATFCAVVSEQVIFVLMCLVYLTVSGISFMYNENKTRPKTNP